MRTVKIIAVLFAATTALGLGACGSDEPGNATARGKQETAAADEVPDAEKDAENKAKPADELAKDVEIVECGEGGTVSVTVEVTNSLDEPMEYIGTVNFLDASGAVLTDGVFNTGTLEPGATSTEEVPGAVYEKVQGLTCELAEVKIDEPV